MLEDVIYDDIVPEVAARRSVGSEELPAISPFGTIDVENLIQPCPFPGASIPLQSWVMPLSSASGRFSVGLNAYRTGDELCPR